MGSGTSSQRHHLYWGAVLLLMLPSPTAHGWNMPFFFGGDGGGPPPTAANDDLPGPTMGSAVVPGRAVGNADDFVGGGGGGIVPRLSAVLAPMIGPADAPHLRYIPSYVPPRLRSLLPAIVSKLRLGRSALFHCLWYKPPVGIVGAYSVLRVAERLYCVIRPPPPSSGEEALADAEGRIGGGGGAVRWSATMMPGGGGRSSIENKMRGGRRRRKGNGARRGRSLDLDVGDRSYLDHGGIETVRVRACQEGLRSAQALAARRSPPPPPPPPAGRNGGGGFVVEEGMWFFDGDDDGNEKNAAVASPPGYARDVDAAIEALRLSCPPRGSRELFVERSAEALSVLRGHIAGDGDGDGGTSSAATAAARHDRRVRTLLRHSSKLIELRALDALVRTLRDRHLVVAARMRRECDFWRFRADLSGGKAGRWIDAARRRLLLPAMRPWLLGLSVSGDYRRQYEVATAAYERELTWLGAAEGLLLRRPAELGFGDLLDVPGFGSAGLLAGAGGDDDDDGEESERSLSRTTQLLSQSRNKVWLRQTERWSREARGVIRDSLDETISSSFTPIDGSSGGGGVRGGIGGPRAEVYAESRFLDKWASYDDGASDAHSWLTVLSLVDYAASPKRAGERRWRFQLSSLLRRYDFLGIPSSALFLAFANSLHDNVIAPHKQEIIDFVRSIFAAIWGIVEFRFYAPMKDIVLDLLNRRPRMVDPFALLNEQTSLDNMLMDLGVGDGTRLTRAAALASASRMYEQELSAGTIRGILRGKVAQLMLIQIQQLKSDLLQAMESIDNLIDANRLNVQLVATIPAVLIIFFGTRLLFVFWSNIRRQDFRLPRDVHAEMSDYLKKVEECLVLSNSQPDGPTSSSTTASEGAGRGPKVPRAEASCLGPKEMGQLLLLLHSYLNLLDYMSPPFPGKTCDSIHQSVQNLLMQGNMSASRQLGLVKLIQTKHDDLLRSSKLL